MEVTKLIIDFRFELIQLLLEKRKYITNSIKMELEAKKFSKDFKNGTGNLVFFY